MKYTDITIKNFRGIQALEIQDCKQVNLLVGRNNCGKTSILEALFLLSGMSNPQLPVNIHQFRDVILNRDEDFSYLFRDLDVDAPITISATLDNTGRELTIQPHYADEPKQGASNHKPLAVQSDTTSALTPFAHVVDGLTLTFHSNGQRQFTSEISLKTNEVSIDHAYQESLRCAFLNPKTIMSEVDQRVIKLSIQKQLPGMITVLQQIEPAVTDLRMGPGTLYVDIGKPKFLPFNIMGDGLRRILAMLAAVADMQNGVVLIDEIENGLHYASLSIVWKAIFAACREYNVQLIATTHSYECIEAFSTIYHDSDPDGDNIRLYRIDRNEKRHQAFAFTAEMLNAGMERAFEVR